MKGPSIKYDNFMRESNKNEESSAKGPSAKYEHLESIYEQKWEQKVHRVNPDHES